MKTLYLDCFSGISGDMSVGALLDAGADFATIRDALHSLGVAGFRVAAEKVNKSGIMATQFRVIQDAHAEHPHRHLHHVTDIIMRGNLPPPVQQAAVATFRIIAEAEAAVHGTTVDKVHFHEVGALDSIVDIVAAQHALHLLGIEAVYASALPVGGGTVKCAHGVFPVPAPATALILKGKPTYGGGAQCELVTPTGAALVAQWARSFGDAPLMRVERVGYGAGTRDLPDRPNLLRVFVGESDAPVAARESVLAVEANIDDMNPELLPPLIAALMDAGARDAFLTPVIAKKGRPAHCVTALCDDASLHRVAQALFAHSTTLGLRMRREERIVLERRWERVRTPWGAVRAKIGVLDGAVRNAAPEFEDCRTLAEQAGVPVRVVYDAALAAAIKGEFEHA